MERYTFHLSPRAKQRVLGLTSTLRYADDRVVLYKSPPSRLASDPRRYLTSSAVAHLHETGPVALARAGSCACPSDLIAYQVIVY